MNIIKCSHCFEFHDHTAFYQKISSEISDRLTIIEDLDRMLRLHLKTIFPQLDCQSILIDFLEESASQRVTNTVNTCDDLFGELIDLFLIRL